MRTTPGFLRGTLLSLIAIGCAAPVSQMGSVSESEIREEQFRQQQFVIRSQLSDQARIDNVGYPLLQAAVPICGPGAASTRTGARLLNVYTFSKEYQPAARALGLSDTLTIVGVTRGSAAERAGIAVGDRVLQLGGLPAPQGRSAMKDAASRFQRIRNADTGYAFVVQHGTLGLTSAASAQAASQSNVQAGAAPIVAAASEQALTIPGDKVCDYNLVAIKDDQLNAWADGKNVYVTSAMLRFASDEELAVVLSHEISHNAMRHMDAKKKNARIGAIFGAILDVAAASQGGNTGGEFTNDMAAAASQAFSQDFEREADYVGMYVLARAGRSYENAADFWRRMAQESPGSIKFASSHPTTAERFVRLEKAAAEIREKQASGKELLPAKKS